MLEVMSLGCILGLGACGRPKLRGIAVERDCTSFLERTRYLYGRECDEVEFGECEERICNVIFVVRKVYGNSPFPYFVC